MKNLKFRIITVTFTAAAFFSCSQSEDLSYDAEQVKVTQENYLIERDIQNLSSVDASKLAKQFSINEYEVGSRAASDVAIKDIQTISSESGKPLMYVVNYADNKGFTVISATKNYTPVLAYSEEGYLNVNDASFTNNIFMDEYKAHIKSVVNVESDSLRQRYAIDWSFYEKKPEIVESRTYTDAQIQQELANARTYYGNQGYEVHSLSAATSLIPASGGLTAEQRANGFIDDICSRTPSEYDCMEVTLLLVKRTNESYGPFVTTLWNPNDPYCADAPYGSAGCATIAAMQMMCYYQWPNTIEWSNITSTYWVGDLNEDQREFSNGVRTSLNAFCLPDGYTSFPEGCIKDGLESDYGYLVTTLNYNRSTAESYMKNGTPLIMYGANTSSDLSHYWICNGYKSNRVQYAAYMIDRDLRVYTFYPGMTDILSEYFLFNMGTGNNTWFYQDTAIYNNSSYTANRKMYLLTPNK